MSYTLLLEDHVATSLKTSCAACQSYQPYVLEMPEYLTQSEAKYTEKIFRTICEAITRSKYIVLDLKNTRSIDRHGLQILSELFLTAYNFNVGLSFVNIPTCLQNQGSLTGFTL